MSTYNSRTVTVDDIQRGQLVWVDGIIDKDGLRLNECNRVMSVNSDHGTVILSMEYLTYNDTGKKVMSLVDNNGIERVPGRTSTYFANDLTQKLSGKGHIWWSIKLHIGQRSV